MYLEKLQIHNFRGISDFSIIFEKDMNVLIGENNTGKSTIIEAVKLLSERVSTGKLVKFVLSDMHNFNGTPRQKYDNINIMGQFLIEANEPNKDDIIKTLKNIIIPIDSNFTVKVNLIGKYNEETNEIDSEIHFLNISEEDIGRDEKNIRLLRNIVPCFCFPAIRNPDKIFSDKIWSSFINEKDIEKATYDEFTSELDSTYQKIFDNHASFDHVCSEIKALSSLLFCGNTVDIKIDPKPSDAYAVLKYQSQLNLKLASSPKLPLNCYGDGTRNLTMFLIFKAYLQHQLSSETKINFPTPIIAIEEPEAHLHPSAIHTTWDLLESFPGQKIVSTHSGDIISRIPHEKIRRLKKNNNSVTCHSLSNMGLDDKEKRLINLHIRDTRGALYYAHCWILVEGSTEKIILSRCADVMGHDLNINGIQIVPFSNSNITVNTKLADYLGIPWILVADGDTGGTGYTAMGNNYVNKMRTDVCNPPYYSIIQLVEQDIETLLCMSGFGSVYYDVIHEKYPIYRNKYPDKTWDDITKGCSDDTKLREKVTEMLTINKNSKPMLVEKVVEKIVEKGKDGVPSQLQSIIITAIRFARGDAS